MKFLKIFATFFLSVFIASDVLAVCSTTQLGTFNAYASNEYIFSNINDYNNGFAYECGKNDCNSGAYIAMSKSHIYGVQWMGTKAAGANRIYRCTTSGGAEWVEQIISEFNDCGADFCASAQGGELFDDYYVFDKKVSKIGIAPPNNNSKTLVATNVTDLCKCAKVGGVVPTPTPDPVTPVVVPVQSQCLKERASWSAEAKACCLLPSSVATLQPKAADGKCTCVTPGYVFNGRSCVPAGKPDVSNTICEEALLDLIAKAYIECETNAVVTGLAATVSEYCNSSGVKDVTLMTNFKAQLKAVIDAGCKEKAPGGVVIKPVVDDGKAQRDESSAAISRHIGSIRKMQQEFGVSVWKDEQGEFNTARLASDSIAGVVLGTTGGIITSKVMRKNQVKEGFGDLSCTIGGQTVAEWGDEFSVGIR